MVEIVRFWLAEYEMVYWLTSEHQNRLPRPKIGFSRPHPKEGEISKNDNFSKYHVHVYHLKALKKLNRRLFGEHMQKLTL